MNKIFVDKSSKFPLFLQIKEQIRHLIVSGHYPPGTKLPSSRELGEFLHVNRLTIARAINQLEAEGYVHSEQGLGTYVTGNVLRLQDRDESEFLEVVRTALRRALEMGYTPDEFVGAAVALSRELAAEARPEFYLVFVECNQPVLDSYRADLEKELGVTVMPVLVEELRRPAGALQQAIDQCGAVVTTFTHLHEVKRLLKDGEVEVMGITAGAYLDLLLRVTQLPETSRILVVTVSALGAAEVVQSLVDVGVNPLRITSGSLEDGRELLAKLEQADWVVVSRAAVRDLERLAPEARNLLVYENVLDRASLNMLRRVLPLLRERWERRQPGVVGHAIKGRQGNA